MPSQPRKYKTTEELREEVARLQAEKEQRRAERVARGLPPDPPPRFVDPSHAAVLMERVQPVYEVITQYLDLTNKAKKVLPFDTSQFDQFERDLVLLEESTVFLQCLYGGCLKKCIKQIEEAQQVDIAHERVVMELFKYLKFANDFKLLLKDKRDVDGEPIGKPYEGEDIDEILEDYWRHYKDNVEGVE